MSQIEGQIDKFIRAFNAYEGDNFERCTESDGLSWWCVVRYNVAHALCMERQLYGVPNPIKNHFFRRLYPFARQSLRLVRDVMFLLCHNTSTVATLYVGTRKLPYFAQSIADEQTPALVVGSEVVDVGAHLSVSKRSIDFWVRIASRFFAVPHEVVSLAEAIDAEIKEQFGTTLNISNIIIAKYRQHRASTVAWRFVLTQLSNLQKVVFVNDDTLKSLVHMARLRGIETEEVQHAYMGKSHEGFCYPALNKPLSTLPDRVVMHKDYGDTVYPVEIVHVKDVVAKANAVIPWKERQIDVLVGGSPGRIVETQEIVAALNDGKRRIAVKLHPAQKEEDYQNGEKPLPDNVVLYTGRGDFEALVAQAKIYIPAAANSTTAFEAVDHGCQLLLVHYGGVKTTEMFDSRASQSVSDFAQLPDAVAKLLCDGG